MSTKLLANLWVPASDLGAPAGAGFRSAPAGAGFRKQRFFTLSAKPLSRNLLDPAAAASSGAAAKNKNVLTPPARGLAKPVRSGGRQ